MSTEPTDLTVFYSWQSDSPSETNRNAIRAALRVASSKLEESSKWRVLYDEATRGSAGSPNIPATILEKIKARDVFVCDITTINSATTDASRKTPNPNVLFELGYAVSQLGWNRIVMVINEAFGTPKAPLTLEQEAAWAVIETARDMLSAAQRALVKQIREEYLEIDLNDTSASTWREYVEFERDMEQRFARSDS